MRRRFHSSRSSSNSNIKSIAETDCYAIAYYLYGIFYDYSDSEVSYDYIDTFFKLVKKANLLEHFEAILKKKIDKMIKDKVLNPISQKKSEEVPKFRGTKIKFTYEEDSEVDDELPRDISSKKSFYLDFYRCFVLRENDEGTFASIISKTFLSGKTFETIPKKIKDVIFDTSKIKFIIDAVNLTQNEARILMLLYRLNTVNEIKDIFNREIYDKISSYCERVLRIDSQEINTIFRVDQKLRSFGFIEEDGEITIETIDCIKSGNMDAFFAEILKEEKTANAFEVSSYSIQKDSIEITKQLLTKNQNVNILLYGEPGSGKTEFARSIAKECGLNAFIFKNDSELNKRENVLCRLNCLLSINKSNSLIIIDEADTILRTQISFLAFLMNSDSSSSKKGTVNKIFENSNNKVIWIVNHTNQIEDSTKRRFNYSIRFNEMPERILRSIADLRLKKVSKVKKISKELHEKILDLCSLYKITGSSVENIAKVIECVSNEKSEGEIFNDVKNVLEANSALLYGKPKVRMNVASTYDETILNTNYPAAKIIKMVENAKRFSEENKSVQNGIRMLFYGLSGTGKTEFARYISQKLGKKILLKRVSDISDKYVGESEKNIKKAFEEAEQTDQILLFDEADSFFADRSNASNSWERTQVNEFLTQMEEFSGILICTTNLKQIMDPAMQRRFHICVEFNPLKSEGIKVLLKKYFENYDFNEDLISKLVKRNTVTPGDFGSLSSRIRFMDEQDINADYIINELCKLQDDKTNEKSIGFDI